MRRAFLFSSGITAIVVGVFTLAYLTSAATTKFSFTGEGTVQEHDFGGKNMRVYFTRLSESAKTLGLGTALDVSVGGAKIYARDARGKLARIKQGNVPIGGRVTVRGTVKSDDRFVASVIERQNTSFTMEGKLRTYSASLNEMTLEITKSNYKSARYLGKTVRFIFSDATKFYSRGASKQKDEVNANDQKVRVEGKEVGTDLEVSSMNELP